MNGRESTINCIYSPQQLLPTRILYLRCHGLDVSSILRSLDSHLYIINGIRSFTFWHVNLVSRGLLQWGQGSASPGHCRPRTLSRTKSNTHACLEGIPGPRLADLEAGWVQVSVSPGKSGLTAYPETEETSSLLDRFRRKVAVRCCHVRLVVVVYLVVVSGVGNGLQCICTHLIPQAGRFASPPSDAVRLFQKGIHQSFRNGVRVARVDPEDIELMHGNMNASAMRNTWTNHSL